MTGATVLKAGPSKQHWSQRFVLPEHLAVLHTSGGTHLNTPFPKTHGVDTRVLC